MKVQNHVNSNAVAELIAEEVDRHGYYFHAHFGRLYPEKKLRSWRTRAVALAVLSAALFALLASQIRLRNTEWNYAMGELITCNERLKQSTPDAVIKRLLRGR